MNRSHSGLLWSAVVVAGATLTGCPIDALRDGIGAPCVIDGDACPTDHVCHVDDGATDGLCAPILDYGSCDPPSYPQAIGKVRDETLDMRIGKIGPLLGPGPAERPAHPHGEAH
jgi:hypothetical protein